MKKKNYETPSVETVIVKTDVQLLAGSVITPGHDNEQPGSRLFDSDDETLNAFDGLLFQ
ncbi:MAG: hypothetical protein IJ559_05705 [Prevotella sp.]|nr:hypothetical protein [Prevotella sp.]